MKTTAKTIKKNNNRRQAKSATILIIKYRLTLVDVIVLTEDKKITGMEAMAKLRRIITKGKKEKSINNKSKE